MTDGGLGSPAGHTRSHDEGADGALVALTDTGSGQRSSRRGWVPLVLTALVVAALIRALLVQVFFIPSASMMPTLAEGDRIAVEKVSLRFDDLDRGDVVVFDDPAPDPSVRERSAPVRLLRGLASLIGVPDPAHQALVKRVVGLPGERVVIDARGRVTVDGVDLDEPYVTNPDRRGYGPVTVPAGEMLVLGDNRPASDDSRGSLGFVAEDLVVGRVAGIVWPPGRAGGLTGPG